MQLRKRVAVVSPFLDKRHGTERCIAEQIERLAGEYEIHIYSNRVEDIDLRNVVWHRVPSLPGPHLFAYCWWFVANHLWRWWDRNCRSLGFDLTYTPGINCLDADVISVHVVFRELCRRTLETLRFSANPVPSWPLLLHRRLYYKLMTALERWIYGRTSVVLTTVSARVSLALQPYRSNRRRDSHMLTATDRGQDDVAAFQPPVIGHGIDHGKFSVERREALRGGARRDLRLGDSDICLLLVGNGWNNKGLQCVIEALAKLAKPCVYLKVVGQDAIGPYRTTLARLGLEDRVAFLPPRADVEFYYAAADLYVGPSLEDAFALPPFEAMACGVPPIVSSQMGVSEIVTDGVDGFILEDPRDSEGLAVLISKLIDDKELRLRMGEAAARTASQYTWERNAEQLKQVFEDVLRRKAAKKKTSSPARS